jgi:hypothetical protein
MVTRKTPAVRIALAAAFLVLALALVPVALAGKGGKPGGGGTTNSGSSLTLVMLADANANGLPNWGDQLTFRVSTSASYPAVELDCQQNGVWVYAQVVGFYPTYMWPQVYTLESPSWTGGAADCTATLYTTAKNGSRATLATTSYHVDA